MTAPKSFPPRVWVQGYELWPMFQEGMDEYISVAERDHDVAMARAEAFEGAARMVDIAIVRAGIYGVPSKLTELAKAARIGKEEA